MRYNGSDKHFELTRKTSLLDRLVKDSKLKLVNQFDREKVRTELVLQKSLFKDKKNLWYVLNNSELLYNKITGAE